MVVPGWKDVVQGSTCATSSRPRVSACSSFSCFPDEPRKMRGLSIRSSRQQEDRVWELSQDTPAIRPWVTAFAAISFALKVGLILLIVVPAVIPVPKPAPFVLFALLAGVIGSTLVRSAVVRRLSATELAAVQFWSITPLLILLVGGALGILPALVLDQLADWLHWSEAALHNLVGFTLAGAMVSAAIVIWVSWKQFRATLQALPSGPA